MRSENGTLVVRFASSTGRVTMDEKRDVPSETGRLATLFHNRLVSYDFED